LITTQTDYCDNVIYENGNAIPESPTFSQSDNGEKSSTTNGIMIYSCSRTVKQYEVQN